MFDTNPSLFGVYELKGKGTSMQLSVLDVSKVKQSLPELKKEVPAVCVPSLRIYFEQALAEHEKEIFRRQIHNYLVQKATAESFESKRASDLRASQSQSPTETQAQEMSKEEEALLELLGHDLTDNNRSIARIKTMLKSGRVVLKAVHPTIFDVLSYVLDTNPGLARTVTEIHIEKDCEADYSKTIYNFTAVIAELIEHASLQQLRLHKFTGKEIVRMLRLQNQHQLKCVNLEDNSLVNDELDLVLRTLPKAAGDSIELKVNGNNLVDVDDLALLFWKAKNVKSVEILAQKTGRLSKDLLQMKLRNVDVRDREVSDEG